MSLDLTKPVRTRDGQAVKLIYINGRGEWAIIGYVGDEDLISLWTLDGKYDAGDDDGDCDGFDLVNA